MRMKKIRFIIPFLIILTLLGLNACKSTQVKKNGIVFLSGVWLGEAHQYDINVMWNIRFQYNGLDNRYIIDYPSVGCGGNWTLIKSNKGTFVFRETIEEGIDICTNGGKVVLEVQDPGHMKFYYYWPDDKTLNASGFLVRTN